MSSYKIIIADDEPMIRKGLECSVSWGKYGFEMVASFMDGQDVIDYLEHHEVDVVLTDVQMCQLGGIEVAQWIRERKLPIKIIMISGYREFEYVKEAMRLDVKDYILKPLDPEEIGSVLCKIKLELDIASANYNKSIDILLSLREDIDCNLVLMAEEKLVDVLITDNDALFTQYCRQWRLAMQEVKKEYLPLLVFHMLDSAYVRLKESGISVSGALTKKNVLRRIGVVEKDNLIEESRCILKEIYQELKYKKSTSKENVIEKAMRYIDEHLSENFGVEELAFYVNLNRSYFSRALRRKPENP